MSQVLILRPEPGAGRTAARARSLGLDPVVAPIFTVRPVAWSPPPASEVDAVILTSANAARHAGPGLQSLLHLPCYAVGETTAEEARRAGFADVRVGPGDGEDLFAMLAGDRVARALHLCGREHGEPGPRGIAVVRRVVYAAEPVNRLPEDASQALARAALVLIHSPRAAAEFARLAEEAGIARGTFALAAISAAAAVEAGGGWKQVAIAAAPRDDALLELAAALCQNVAR